MSPYALKLSVFFGVLLIMGIVEQLVKTRPWSSPPAKRWLFHAGVSIFNTVLTRVVAAAPLLLWLNTVNDQGWGLMNVLGIQGLPQVLISIFFFDAYDYWWHRFNHTVPFLWRFHRVHHLDTHVDVTTSLRFHPGELFLSYIAKTVWIGVWGPSLVTFIVCESVITFYSQFHHSNIDFPDSFENKLRLIHVTPRVHASHHTATPRTRNANFSTVFLIWDKLFGTFQEPDREEMKKMGVGEERDSEFGFWKIMKAPFLKSNLGGSVS